MRCLWRQHGFLWCKFRVLCRGISFWRINSNWIICNCSINNWFPTCFWHYVSSHTRTTVKVEKKCEWSLHPSVNFIVTIPSMESWMEAEAWYGSVRVLSECNPVDSSWDDTRRMPSCLDDECLNWLTNSKNGSHLCIKRLSQINGERWEAWKASSLGPPIIQGYCQVSVCYAKAW